MSFDVGVLPICSPLGVLLPLTPLLDRLVLPFEFVTVGLLLLLFDC